MPKPAAIGSACGRALRRSVPLVVATCALCAVSSAAYGAHHFVTSSPRFAVVDITIRGTEQVSAEDIRAALPIRLGDNVFASDPDELAAVARRHPWVASATAERILPNKIVIDVREHVPAAIVVLDKPYLVDQDGRPFKRAELDEADGKRDLPVVTGLDREMYRRDPVGTAKTIVSALGALAVWQLGGERPAIGEVHIDAHGALTFRTYDRGTRVQLGDFGSELVARIRTFDAAWESLSPSERERTRAIHLAASTDHVTVAFKD